MELAVAAAVLGMTAMVLLVLGASRLSKANNIQDRLESYATQDRMLEADLIERSFYDRAIRPLLVRIARLISRFVPGNTEAQLRRNLLAAGSPNGLELPDLLASKGAAAVIGAAAAVLLAAALRSPLITLLLALPVGAVLGFYLPNAYVRLRVSARTRALQRALPDALDLLAIGIEAGLPFERALQRVVSKWDTPLTFELRRVLADIDQGRPRSDALRGLAERTQLAEIQSFVAAVNQAGLLGLPLAPILRQQADLELIRRRQRVELQARRAPMLMLVVVVLLVLPALCMVLLGPMAPRLVELRGG